MAKARRCAGCGASLQDPEAGRASITCPFCGLTHDLTGQSGPRAVVVEIGQNTRREVGRAGRAIAYAVLGIAALGLGIGGWVAYEASKQAVNIVDRVTTAVQQGAIATPARKSTLALTDLPTITEWGWKTVDTPPPPGGYAEFEPVAALPWAMTIAHAWASDAVLTRIDVGRVAATGAVDLSGEATSGYRFVSPARQARWKQETDAGSKSVTRTGMMLQIQGDTARVLLEEGRGRAEASPPAPGETLPLPALLERARQGRGFQDRPFYSGYMIHLPREGWVWYFVSPSGDSFPRARARDGRTYPY